MRGRGGPITAAVDGPGGPILAGDHRRRDTSPSSLPNCQLTKVNNIAVTTVDYPNMESHWTHNHTRIKL